MSLLVFLIFLVLWGLVIGALARFALPGPDPMGLLGTMALGLAGSFTAGLLAGLLWHRAAGFILSVLASTALLYGYRRIVQKRGITGPDARRLPPPR
jgi:uncharacterized membrane protein YeaQ/YmgE (transglycosylase-associated protein family)